MKIGQYLTKLCIDYVGLLFLAHPVLPSHKFVGLLVRSFVRGARCDFSKTATRVFMKFGTDVQYLSQM